MTKSIFITFYVLGLMAMPSVSAFAEAESVAVQESTAEADSEVLLEEKRRVSKEANALLREIFSTLDEQEQRHYYQMQNSYNLVETIKIVQGDVADAIQGCGENNPEMKDELDARFSTWNGAITPVMDEAEGHFKNMLLVQDYADPKMLDELFSLLEQTRDYTREYINKIPVTTKDACEYLLGKMDETQVNLINRLRAAMASVPDTTSQNLDAVSEEPSSDQGASDL